MSDALPTIDGGPAAASPSWTRVGGGASDLTIEENWLFRLRRERFQSRTSGRVHDFYVMHLADAVYAIALTPDDKMVLVRQFRAASMHDSLEAPGGLLEPGEDPCAAGARELLEETGYAGDPATVLGTLWSNPSIVTSRTTTIVIRNARRVAEPRLDHNEELEVELVPAAQILELIRQGRIDHALCVAGLLWWLHATSGEPLV
jgi:8-oxo-dGTP pyrophosphatase MutT (NUDIX family)